LTGGIDLAAEWAGFETVGQCEWADYPTKVLEKHWPDVERWRDVRSVTIEDVRNRGIREITLLSGGFPCQPHSIAGERKASDDERDLWPENKRIICELKPKWYLGENVPGLLSSENGRFFGGILRDLVGMGYSVGWCCLPAYAVGTVFEGKRVFIIAKANSFRIQGSAEEALQGQQTRTWEQDVRSIEEWARRSVTYEPKLCRSYNGFSGGVDRVKALGNAVVPQQVYPILQAIADIERS
jgi:DNA (cytosine-5)-methyltransferase 1